MFHILVAAVTRNFPEFQIQQLIIMNETQGNLSSNPGSTEQFGNR